uniref:Uncharacterized protein n=1 Tax=Ditylenchus dipsaci TaxID=166011 RepID=A0A915CYS5_9BILA
MDRKPQGVKNTQNIRAAALIRKLVIALFTAVILLTPVYFTLVMSEHLVLAGVCFEIFDWMVAIYAHVLPVIIIHELNDYKNQLNPLSLHSNKCTFSLKNVRRVFHKHEFASNVVTDRAGYPAQLKNVLGTDLRYSTPERETKEYFTQLEVLWGVNTVNK